MNDLAKIALGVLGGFLVGVAMEPLKFWLAEKLRRNQMRTALIGNIAYVCGQFAQASHLNKGQDRSAADLPEAIEVLNSIKLDIFDHYYKDEKALFWRLPNAGWIHELFEMARWVLTDADGHRVSRITEFFDLVEALFTERYLPKRLLARRFRDYYHRNIEEVLKPGWVYGSRDEIRLKRLVRLSHKYFPASPSELER